MRYFTTLLTLIVVTNLVWGQAKEEELNLNFVDVELEVFIDFVAKETGKRIIYDQSVRGKKLFLQCAVPVPRKDLMKIFRSVMEYQGYVLETTGTAGSEVIKLKRAIQGPWTTTPTFYDIKELEKVKDQDKFVTMVIKLKHISAREVQTTLRALRIVNPQGGNLAGIEGSNTLLVTDFAPNVRRVYEVIQLMDQKGQELQLEMIRLKYADPDAVVEKINQFAIKTKQVGRMGPGIGHEEVKAVADQRMRAVIVQAYPEKMAKIKKIVKALDQPIETEPSGIHYYALKHADASQLQETLTKLIEGAPSLSGGGQAAPPAASGQKASLAGEGLDERRPVIQAEVQTNSLIVKADRRDWEEIRKIIEKVDVRRPQVLLEAAIVEIRPEDVLNLGVELFYTEKPSDGKAKFLGGTDFGYSNLVAIDDEGKATPLSPGADIPDANLEKFGKLPAPQSPFGITGFTYDDLFTIPVLLNMLKTERDFKVLSIPRVLTNDNQQAKIKVADSDPTSTTATTAGSPTTTAFGGYQDAGTEMIITPHISGEKNYLRLDIQVTISEFGTAQQTMVQDEEGGVTVLPRPKTSREITTSVTIPNGQTIVLGGQTQETSREIIQKVPILGDIPILGYLFQSRVIEHNVRNVYVFITPHILREEQFKDLYKLSYDSKVDLSKLGGNVGAFDPYFKKYNKRYGLNQQQPIQSMYMLEYKSPRERGQK